MGVPKPVESCDERAVGGTGLRYACGWLIGARVVSWDETMRGGGGGGAVVEADGAERGAGGISRAPTRENEVPESGR
jgi:hypothetical protein